MHLHGDNLEPNQVVTVNGRPIMADVQEVNTDEGWVDICLPVLEEVTEHTQNGKPFVDTEYFPTFTYEVKRLTGEIKIVELKIPTQ